MYHPPSKRKQLLQRTLTYGFMTLAVIALLVVLVFVMLGYRFNAADGHIEQGGLVQFDTEPNGATVTVDGRQLSTRTPSKLTATTGHHFITMERKGYDTWQKAVKVTPGGVLWLNYARLVPSELKPVPVADFKEVSDALASPDMKKMAIKQAAGTAQLTVADLTREDARTETLALPENSYTRPENAKSQKFTLEKWHKNSRYLLVKHSFDGQKEWLVVDTEDASRTKNISTLLDIDASRVAFHGSNGRIVYVQVDNDVRKVDIDAETLSRPLVRDVAEFSVFDTSTLVYSTVRGKNGARSVGYYQDGADKPYVIRSYTDDGKTPLKIAVGKYFGEMYEAVAYGEKVEVLKGDLPKTDAAAKRLKTVAEFAVPGGAKYLSVVTDGRFVVAQKGASYTVHDLELKKTTTTELKGSGKVAGQLPWLDDYMVWSDRGGMLRLYEFDGANQHDIMKVTPGLSATLSPSGKYLYGFSKDKDGTYHLQRVRMIL